MRAPALLAAAALLLSAAPRARAGSISLVVTSTAELRAGSLRVAVKVMNAGDEAAANVRPALAFLGQEAAAAAAHASLVPGQSFETELALEAPRLGAGRWPFRVAVDYADSAFHSFQTLQVAAIVLGEPGPSDVEIGGVTSSPVTHAGSVEVRLRNVAASSRETAISLLAPRDLEVEEPSRRVVLPAGAEAFVSFRVVPRGALPGSRYAVFALVEYDGAAGHQAVVKDALVEVRERRSRLAPALGAGSAALLLAWAILVLRRRGRSP
jgi:hypothetical protein